MPRTAVAILFLIGSAAILSAQTPPASSTAELKNASGHTLGDVTVTAAPHGVLLRIQVKGLTPGWHGVHFHEKADCSDAKFKNAGGHIHSKTPVIHGLLNPDANDSGDLPNIYATADGAATVELYSTLVSLNGEVDRPALLDQDGSALVIHAHPDDYKSQPIGGAGDRVACAEIR
ncbi:MAG: superoxide dismutase family protein [Acidobacteriaceae bacterium]